MCFSERKNDDSNNIVNNQNKELSNGLDKNDTVMWVLATMAIWRLLLFKGKFLNK